MSIAVSFRHTVRIEWGVVETTESGTRSRTRAAILDAGIALLAEDGNASLADIAERADVGRSTLHRYFPERSDLLRAVGREIMQRVDLAITRADPESGPFLEAIGRLVDEMLEHGRIVGFVYSDPTVLSDTSLWEEALADVDDDAVTRRFAREEGSFRPGITAHWASSVFWALLYSGWESMKAGTMTRREAADAILTTFAGGILRDEAQPAAER